MEMQVLEMRQALCQALDEELEKSQDVVILGEEVAAYNGAYKVTKGLLDKWGSDRIIDTPISENAFAGLAIGAAMTGLRPVVEFMSWNFSFVAFDQIVSNAAKLHYMSGGRFSVPVVFRGPNGAAAQVSSQHSHCVEAIYSNLPGLIIVSPSTPYDAKGLLKAAIANNNPVLFLENELLYGFKGEVPTGDYSIALGKAAICREGTDLTLVSHSRMLHLCLEAAQKMQARGISCEVVDLRTIKPLDMSTVCGSLRKTHRLVCVEEGHLYGGVAAEVCMRVMELCFDALDAPPVRVCQRETPMPYSQALESQTLPTLERICEAIENLF